MLPIFEEEEKGKKKNSKLIIRTNIIILYYNYLLKIQEYVYCIFGDNDYESGENIYVKKNNFFFSVYGSVFL